MCPGLPPPSQHQAARTHGQGSKAGSRAAARDLGAEGKVWRPREPGAALVPTGQAPPPPPAARPRPDPPPPRPGQACGQASGGPCGPAGTILPGRTQSNGPDSTQEGPQCPGCIERWDMKSQDHATTPHGGDNEQEPSVVPEAAAQPPETAVTHTLNSSKAWMSTAGNQGENLGRGREVPERTKWKFSH